MPEGFQGLVEAIVERKKEISEDEYQDTAIIFLRDIYNNVDDAIERGLDAPEKLCRIELIGSDGELRRKISSSVQLIDGLRQNIHSAPITEDIYYFLQDIREDLHADDANIVIVLGNKVSINGITNIFIDEFDDLEALDEDFYNSWITDLQDKNCYVVKFPRSEVQNPLNLALLVHECIHQKDMWNDFDDIGSIPGEIREEVLTDLISVHYMGPVYAFRLAKLPGRIGNPKGIDHPSQITRLNYFIKYMNFIDEKNTAFSIFDEVGEYVTKELEDEITNSEGNPTKIEGLSSIHEQIHDSLSSNGIPTYIGQTGHLDDYLEMPHATEEIIEENINELFIEGTGAGEVELPIKPCLALNLAILADEYEDKSMRNAVLGSFKKWYVTNRLKGIQMLS